MLFITPCACFLMTEAFLAVKAMQDEQVACHVLFQLESMYKALLDCGVPYSLGLRAFWPETWLVLCRECISWWQKHGHTKVNFYCCLVLSSWGDSSGTKAGIPAWIVLTLMESWSQQGEDLPLVSTYSWMPNVQTEVKNWFQRRLHLRTTCLDWSAINSWPLPHCLPRSRGFNVAYMWLWGMQNCFAEFS